MTKPATNDLRVNVDVRRDGRITITAKLIGLDVNTVRILAHRLASTGQHRLGLTILEALEAELDHLTGDQIERLERIGGQ